MCVCLCVHAQLLQSCLTLWDLMDCSLTGFSVHGILQARILEWLAMPSSRGSSRPWDGVHISGISCIEDRFFTIEPPWNPCVCAYIYTHICTIYILYIYGINCKYIVFSTYLLSLNLFFHCHCHSLTSPFLSLHRIYPILFVYDQLSWTTEELKNANYFFCFFFNLFTFNWRIIAVQNFVVFCQISTWISHRYIYIPSLLKLPPIFLPIPLL